jgi:imidazolonepropionase
MNASAPKLIGPFTEILTMRGLPDKGPIRDDRIEIVRNGGIVVTGKLISEVGNFNTLRKQVAHVEEVDGPAVALPGLVDAHTHLCFSGNRAKDYSLRISGTSYQEILRQGGGIYDTVERTRAATDDELLGQLLARLQRHLEEGVTTCEVKSGYGLSVEEELRLLRIIHQAEATHTGTVVATCLAAHVPPRDQPDPAQYLEQIIHKIFPVLIEQKLSNRIDIFVEPEAFPTRVASSFLKKAREQRFDVTIHADQFSSGGSELATQYSAISADHLEASSDVDIQLLAMSEVTATVLPGASLGLGMNFAPARKLLDAGCRLAIATDWNPGSAPMGDLLLQAALIGAHQKLTTAETLSAITRRAAKAVHLFDRGKLTPGLKADIISFPVNDHREILYYQGKLKPDRVWVDGNQIGFKVI